MAYVKYPDSKQLKRDLQKKDTEQIYLFLGEEEGDKDKCISMLLDIVFTEKEERRNSSGIFHMNNNEFLDGVDFAVSSSMFAENRVCILRDIDSIGNTKENKLLMAELFESLQDTTYLIMTSPQNKVPSLIPKDYTNRVFVFQFWRYFDQDILNYVTITSQKMGLKMESSAIDFLLKLTGKDIRKIDDSLEMLLYADHSECITDEDIKNILTDVRDTSVFEFIDFLFLKDKRAFSVLKKLLEDNIPELQILSLVYRQTEQIERYHNLLAHGKTTDDAMKECGIYQKKKSTFMRQTASFPIERIRELFGLLMSADKKLKSFRPSKDVISNPLYDMTVELFFASSYQHV